MILKHRDKELLQFEWIEPEDVRIVSVNESSRCFLPLDINLICRMGAAKNGYCEVRKMI